jgi:predicted N-acyltransferase
LSSRKRKDLRKERAAAQQGIAIRTLSGSEIRAEHWDAVLAVLPGHRRAQMGQPVPDPRSVRVVRRADGRANPAAARVRRAQPIAGALNFIGRRGALRSLLGCLVDKPFLHFELCYYQAIDAAIERGLARVEAGAQGGHKLARGYQPVQTWSMHWIADSGFRAAVADFLERERLGVAQDQVLLGGRTPFRNV